MPRKSLVLLLAFLLGRIASLAAEPASATLVIRAERIPLFGPSLESVWAMG